MPAVPPCKPATLNSMALSIDCCIDCIVCKFSLWETALPCTASKGHFLMTTEYSMCKETNLTC